MLSTLIDEYRNIYNVKVVMVWWKDHELRVRKLTQILTLLLTSYGSWHMVGMKQIPIE